MRANREHERATDYHRAVLTRAASLDDFLARPLRRYVVGKSYLLWVASPTLAGAVHFARPGPEEIVELLGAATLPLHPSLRPPYDALIDASRLDELTIGAFEALVGHLRDAQAFSPLIRRVACVRPRGMLGATLAGLFYEGVQAHFPCALFQEPTEAFAWLAHPEAAPIACEVLALIETLAQTPPLLRRLREHLAAARGQSDLRSAARALGVAERSLQRHLREAGTTFRVESDRVCIALAERLLLRDDTKIETVALDAGFNSASHLARMFRRHTGETPAEFRKKRRS
jgi:AraC-like DNA-binding protein